MDDGEEACDYCSYAYEIGENGREGEKPTLLISEIIHDLITHIVSHHRNQAIEGMLYSLHAGVIAFLLVVTNPPLQ